MAIPQKRILRLPEVCQITGLAKATIYKKVADGSFPKIIKLTSRSSGFLEEDVFNWIEARIQASTATVEEASGGNSNG